MWRLTGSSQYSVIRYDKAGLTVFPTEVLDDTDGATLNGTEHISILTPDTHLHKKLNDVMLLELRTGRSGDADVAQESHQSVLSSGTCLLLGELQNIGQYRLWTRDQSLGILI